MTKTQRIEVKMQPWFRELVIDQAARDHRPVGEMLVRLAFRGAVASGLGVAERAEEEALVDRKAPGRKAQKT